MKRSIQQEKIANQEPLDREWPQIAIIGINVSFLENKPPHSFYKMKYPFTEPPDYFIKLQFFNILIQEYV